MTNFSVLLLCVLYGTPSFATTESPSLFEQLFPVLVLAVVIFYVWARSKKKEMVCKDCGLTGKIRKTMRGSLLIEVILWIALLIPGLIYTAWRFTTKLYVCPSCGSRNVIPSNSPFGQKLLAQNNELEKIGNTKNL